MSVCGYTLGCRRLGLRSLCAITSLFSPIATSRGVSAGRRSAVRGCSGLPAAVTVLADEGSVRVLLLGTVHFSKSSVEDVTKVVEILKPNAIMVELCRQRASLLNLDDEKFLKDAKNFSAAKARKEAMRGDDVMSGMAHAMLLKTYADISKELGVAPGAEFRQAYREMLKIPGCKLFLGDRPIQITLARAFRSLSLFELAQLWAHLLFGKSEPISVEQLELYKNKEFVNQQFKQISNDSTVFQKIFRVFVEERDVCLAYSLQECVRAVRAGGGEARVLGVVGAGHADGVRAHYGRVTVQHIVPLMTVPPTPLSRRVLGWTVKWTFFFLLFSFIYRLIFG